MVKKMSKAEERRMYNDASILVGYRRNLKTGKMPKAMRALRDRALAKQQENRERRGQLPMAEAS